MSESLARKRIRKLWRRNDLFHNFGRTPYKKHAKHIDRLARILKEGLVAPASCQDGGVCPDLNIIGDGLAIPYDSLIFLHLMDDRSWLYTMSEPGRMTLFIDPKLPVMSQADMGEKWCILCQDEVYVRDRVGVEHFQALAVNEADADSILDEFLPEFERLALPVYLYDGTCLWPKAQVKA